MGSGNNNPDSIYESEEKGGQRISVAHQINGLEYAGQKADSFIVDIERFSPQTHSSHHISDKDVNPNSRVTLQRSLSRKGSTQKKSNSNDITNNNLVAASPRDALHGSSTPEKSMVVTVGSTDHAVVTTAQLHNAITINVAGNSGGGTPSESKIGGRRFSFKRSSSPSWTVIDPRRILFFFATISSMGTILLIYFTLSISKLNGEENGLD